MGLKATATTAPETREGATDATNDCASEIITMHQHCCSGYAGVSDGAGLQNARGSDQWLY